MINRFTFGNRVVIYCIWNRTRGMFIFRRKRQLQKLHDVSVLSAALVDVLADDKLVSGEYNITMYKTKIYVCSRITHPI